MSSLNWEMIEKSELSGKEVFGRRIRRDIYIPFQINPLQRTTPHPGVPYCRRPGLGHTLMTGLIGS